MTDRYRCDLCWEEFEEPVALLLHEAQEDDQLYEVDGYTPPSMYAESEWVT